MRKPKAKKPDIRIIEITNCSQCPHCDMRWTNPPWYCNEGGFDIFRKHFKAVHPDCPLDKAT